MPHLTEKRGLSFSLDSVVGMRPVIYSVTHTVTLWPMDDKDPTLVTTPYQGKSSNRPPRCTLAETGGCAEIERERGKLTEVLTNLTPLIGGSSVHDMSTLPGILGWCSGLRK
ncbi:protein IQ-DOMAIN 1-like [Pyrus ussuriensis x Pyrus communis]|uniref:Protein IQ-DOMAIN 1-like n=1 Tax=Pyrus ussuriensis x Pyrus communis TaxID=2448454 RepID=A0A5N5FTH6_9ROSA|nr:protein IQ-DOMAIN 1-like [Pyrus ussuriensis x Pyrus communis]